MSSKTEIIEAIKAFMPETDAEKLRKRAMTSLLKELERAELWSRAIEEKYDVPMNASAASLKKLLDKHTLIVEARQYDVNASIAYSIHKLEKIIEHGKLLIKARTYRPHISGDLSTALLRTIIAKEESPEGTRKRAEDARRREIYARYFQLFNKHAATLKKGLPFIEARIAEREAEIHAEEQKRIEEQKRMEEEKRNALVPGFKYTEAPTPEGAETALRAVSAEDEKHIVRIHPLSSFKVFRSQEVDLQSVNSYEKYFELFNVLCERFNTSKLCNLVIRLVSSSGDIRHITIIADHLGTFADFIKQVNLITTGGLAGSDAIDVVRYTFDFDYMKLTWYEISAFDRKEARVPIFTKVYKCKLKRGECLAGSIIFQQPSLKRHYDTLKGITDLEEMNDYLTNHGYYLTVYNDWPVEVKTQEAKMHPTLKKRMQKIEHSGIRVLFQGEKLENFTEIKLVWFDNHVEPYEGVASNVEAYFDSKYDVYYRHDPESTFEVYKRAMAEKDHVVKVKAFKTKIIVYDFETVFDIDEMSCLHTYSISWAIKEEDSNMRGKDDQNAKLRGAFVLGATREIVCAKFVDMLVKEQNDSLICLVGYNSSRFDNFFLIPELMKRDLLDDINYQGNSILNISWGGRHCSFDICRYTTGRLEAVAQNFKCKYLKVSGFDHDVIQKHYNQHQKLSNYFHDEDCKIKDEDFNMEIFEPGRDGGSDSLLDGSVGPEYYEKKELGCKCKKYNDLCVYNMFDVLSCVELYDKIETILLNQGIIQGEQRLYDKRTIGGAIYSKFANDNKHSEIPLLTLEQYNLVRSGLVAGRVQCYGGPKYDLTGNNEYRMLDVKSLYPYVMLNRYYPYGEIISCSYEECVLRDLIGFFWCTIDQSNLRVNVLPKRPPKGSADSLDWNYKGEMKMFISTIDIACLKDAGARVSVDATNSIVFSQKIHGSVLFKCQDEFKKIKENEDAKPKGERNGALREMSKLFLNSLSGKVIENLHVEKTELVRTDAQMKRIIECVTRGEKKELPTMHLANQLSESAGIVKYKCSDEDVFKKDNRPIYLGVCIYAHARDHMYRSILKDYDVIYQDTDSALIPINEYKRYVENDNKRIANGEEPLLGGSFGQFELEEGSENMTKFISIAPKNYFIMDKDNKLIKKGFKGVNIKPNGDKLILNPNEPELKDYIINYSQKRKDGTEYVFHNLNTDKAYELYKSDKLPSVYSNVTNFIDQIINQGYAYVLCSYMKKNLTSGNVRDAEGNIIGVREPGMLYQQFMIKKITAKGFGSL